MKALLFIHPVMQLLATLAALYVLYLGWLRFKSLHLGRPTSFPRRRHAIWGAAVLLVWLAGFWGGLLTVDFLWGARLVTPLHGPVAVACLPLIIIGLITGWILYRRPAPRRALPLVHGINNLALVILALVQVYSGGRMALGLLGW